MVSRQRKWQIKQQEMGNCIVCGRKAVTKNFCEFHRQIANKRSRIYQARLREKRDYENL